MRERVLIHSYSIPLTLYRTLTGTLGGVFAAWKWFPFRQAQVQR